jgi:hypothetical protein
MGFNFQSGHPQDIVADSDEVVAILTTRFGPALPLGTPGNHFSLDDEMAWSWWNELQTFAASELGDAATPQIRATDAWYGVYVDAPVTRELLRHAGAEPEAKVISITRTPDGLLTKLRRLIGLGAREERQSEVEAAAHQAMQAMVDQYGARAGENGALQVGNLRALIAELESLLRLINAEPTAATIEALRQSYSADDRVDSDGHIQCLCHAWLTATHALAHKAPLWLVK